MLIVLVLPGILFPPKKTANGRALKDSVSGGQAVGDTSRAADTARTARPPAVLPAVASPFVCPATRPSGVAAETVWVTSPRARFGFSTAGAQLVSAELDRKSTRLNSSHTVISYAVFCLKKKNDTTSSANPEAYHTGERESTS